MLREIRLCEEKNSATHLGLRASKVPKAIPEERGAQDDPDLL